MLFAFLSTTDTFMLTLLNLLKLHASTPYAALLYSSFYFSSPLHCPGSSGKELISTWSHSSHFLVNSGTAVVLCNSPFLWLRCLQEGSVITSHKQFFIMFQIRLLDSLSICLPFQEQRLGGLFSVYLFSPRRCLLWWKKRKKKYHPFTSLSSLSVHLLSWSIPSSMVFLSSSCINYGSLPASLTDALPMLDYPASQVPEWTNTYSNCTAINKPS